MPKRLIGTALLCAVLLGAAACGSGGGSPGKFVPRGSAAAGAPPSGGAEANSAVPALRRFPFPASVHVDFHTPLPADPQAAAAARTEENFQLAYYYAVYSGGKDMTVLSYVSSLAPSVRTATTASVARNRADSFTGTVRFYRTTVTVPRGAPGDRTVTSCVNDAKMLNTSRRTGRVLPHQSTAPAKTVFLESDTLAPAGGAWKIVATSATYYPSGAAKECYP